MPGAAARIPAWQQTREGVDRLRHRRLDSDPSRMRVVRFLRGALTLAILWGLAWGATMAILMACVWTVLLRSLVGGESFLHFVGIRACEAFLMGAIAGAAFAGLLAIAERRRSVATLGRWRVAIWGAAAAAVLIVGDLARHPVEFQYLSASSLLKIVMVWTLVGAGSAVGTLAAARRGELSAGEDAAKFIGEARK
jgi:hypothetical protein